MQVTLPNGQRLNLDLVHYSLTSYTITFTMAAGGTLTYVDAQQSAANAAYVMQQLDAAKLAGVTVLAPLLATRLVITSVNPTSFDIPTATVTIKGSGFSPGSVGLLWIEDVAGGFDLNGFSMTCTYVDANTLTAVLASVGDSNAGQTAWEIGYIDAAGAVSNAILCTGSGTVVVSMP